MLLRPTYLIPTNGFHPDEPVQFLSIYSIPTNLSNSNVVNSYKTDLIPTWLTYLILTNLVNSYQPIWFRRDPPIKFKATERRIVVGLSFEVEADFRRLVKLVIDDIEENQVSVKRRWRKKKPEHIGFLGSARWGCERVISLASLHIAL